MEQIKEKIQKEVEELKKEFTQRAAGWILAGFGLVAALAWNEAIKSLFDMVLGTTKASLLAKFIYAVIVTIIVVMASKRLAHLADKNLLNDSKEN